MPLSTIKIPNDEYFAEVGRLTEQGREVEINVVGHSMEPFIEGFRDTVRLVRCHNARKGDFILALTTANRYVAHRVIKVEGEKVTMRGDGNVYGTEISTQRDIVGKVTHYRPMGSRQFRPLYTWRWRVYSLLWPANPLLRRCALAFHHHIWLRALWMLRKPEWMKLDRQYNQEQK